MDILQHNKWKAGDKIKILRNKSKNSQEHEYSHNYPAIGLTGILEHYITEWDEWKIKWDNEIPGDLVREWMFDEESNKKISKEFGISKFCKEKYGLLFNK